MPSLSEPQSFPGALLQGLQSVMQTDAPRERLTIALPTALIERAHELGISPDRVLESGLVWRVALAASLPAEDRTTPLPAGYRPVHLAVPTALLERAEEHGIDPRPVLAEMLTMEIALVEALGDDEPTYTVEHPSSFPGDAA